MEWTDATSYSQGQRGIAPQTAWETTIAGVRIWVSCGHRFYPSKWIMSCRGLYVAELVIGGTDEIDSEIARNMALDAAFDAARAQSLKMAAIADAIFATPHTSPDEE